MSNFFQVILDPGFLFLRYAVIAGLLASVAFGIVGTYVVARRISYLAGAMAHVAIGGIGAALYLKTVYNLTWLDPLYGALVVCVLCAPLLGWVSMHAKEREDTIMSALWVVGMSGGLLLIAMTPGYVDAMSYLFGDILILSSADLKLIGVLDILVIALGVYFYHALTAFCFDSEFAKLRGLGAGALFNLLLILTACTVVLLIRIVGVVMVLALLSLPPAIAAYSSKKLWQMMLISCVLVFVFIFLGLWSSYEWELPTGPCIALWAGFSYLIFMTSRMLFKCTQRRLN
jgi:zinc transport system permease protein